MAILRNVKVLFSNVLNVDDFTGKYQVVVQLDESQAADAEDAGLIVKHKEHDGKSQIQATFKTKFKPRIVGQIASKDLDLEGSELGRGSVINVQYKFREWKAPGGKTGVGQDLQQLQVVDLQGVTGNEFGDVEEFGDMNGDI